MNLFNPKKWSMFSASSATSENEQKAPSVAPSKTIAPDRQWDRFGTMVQEEINPRTVQDMLESSLSGDPEVAHQVFCKMEDTWDRLMKNIHELRNASARQTWTIEPYAEKGEDPTDSAIDKANLVEDLIRKMRSDVASNKNGMREMLYDIADAVGKGTSVQEIDWKFEDGRWAPKSTRWVDPRYYGLDPQGTHLGLRNLKDNPAWQPFPKHKFIVAAFKNRSGSIMGYGLFRALAWWWACGIFSRQWLVRYAEFFGIPFRVARHEPGADDDEKWAIVTGLEEMGASGVTVVPKGTEIELLESTKSASDNPQTVLLDRRDRSADILILGQTLTTDVGDSGSRALGEVHENIRMDRLVEVTEWTADVVNASLIPAIVSLNFGDTDELPVMKLEIPEAGSALEKIQRDAQFVSIAPMGKKHFYDRNNTPIPSEDEDVIYQPGAANPGFAGTQHVSATGGGVPPEGNDLLDNAISEITGLNAKWLAPLKPKLGALFALAADESVSDDRFEAAMEDLISQVPGVFDSMDKGALADHLEAIEGASAVNGAAERIKNTKGAEKVMI